MNAYATEPVLPETSPSGSVSFQVTNAVSFLSFSGDIKFEACAICTWHDTRSGGGVHKQFPKKLVFFGCACNRIMTATNAPRLHLHQRQQEKPEIKGQNTGNKAVGQSRMAKKRKPPMQCTALTVTSDCRETASMRQDGSGWSGLQCAAFTRRSSDPNCHTIQ